MNEQQTKILLKKGQLWDKIVLDELGKNIAGEIAAREAVFLCALGSLVKNAKESSYNLIFGGGSSGGKDHIIKEVLKLFPKENVISRTRLSKTVLNYWKPYEKSKKESWDGMILYLPDVSEDMLNSETLKLMCSEGSHITITENTRLGKEAVDIEIKGKPVIFTTTAEATATEQTKNRFAVVKIDESIEQTKNVLGIEARESREGEKEQYGKEIIKFIAGLKRYKVKVPFAKKLVKHFPTEEIRARRDFPRLLEWIKSVACFNQQNRTHHYDGSITAELEDYEIAKNNYEHLQFGLDEIQLSKGRKEIIEILKKAEEPLSCSEIHAKIKAPIYLDNFRPHLETLVKLNILDRHIVERAFSSTITKYSLRAEFLSPKVIKLPNSVDL